MNSQWIIKVPQRKLSWNLEHPSKVPRSWFHHPRDHVITCEQIAPEAFLLCLGGFISHFKNEFRTEWSCRAEYRKMRAISIQKRRPLCFSLYRYIGGSIIYLIRRRCGKTENFRKHYNVNWQYTYYILKENGYWCEPLQMVFHFVTRNSARLTFNVRQEASMKGQRMM